MKSKRRKSRELAMQMLFQADLGRQSPDQVQTTFWKSRDAIDTATQGFAEDLFRAANARLEEIDALITEASRNWRLERMPAVDRNVLRVAVAEMLAYPATPLPIIINEALEIGRIYAAPESIQFLNGVLDTIARQLPRPAKQLRPATAGNTTPQP